MKTRRQFLKTYAAAGAGPLILKSGLLAKGKKTRKTKLSDKLIVRRRK